MIKKFGIAVGSAGLMVSSISFGDCTIAQVMKTVHAKSSYEKFEYGSNWSGEQGAPTQRQNEDNDQYLFWIDDNGNSCPAIVTYESGSCLRGRAVVKMKECQ